MEFIELGGKWNLKSLDGKYNLDVNVPGDVCSQLLASGIISDPYYRDNENSLQWIGETDWIYSKCFELEQSFISKMEFISLKCHGLDTLAAIKINGILIANTDNMFRTYEWSIAQHLKVGSNLIEIYFSSPVKYIKSKQKERRLACWGMKTGFDKKWNYKKAYKVNAPHGWLRKEQCNFGWDWSPKLVTSGIWKDLEIIGREKSDKFKSVIIRQKHLNRLVILSVDINLENKPSKNLFCSIKIRKNGLVIATRTAKISHLRITESFTVNNPSLWWPSGMGRQSLYELDVKLIDKEKHILDKSVKKFGLRTIKLICNKDKWGESFYFKINNRPFFAKGANWVPSDALLGKMNKDKCKYLLESATESNMNMIRVWGGGIYESDYFYDLCDEMGIMVWQDFMFACAAYPIYDDKFIHNIEQEVVDVLNRIGNHPSIALWCGSNELEMGLVSPIWTKYTMGVKDYKKVFEKVIPNVIKTYTPEIQYWPSSPHTTRGIKYVSNSHASGDAHLWEVWHGKKPFEWFRTCKHRFVSEFGIQSFPTFSAIEKFTLHEDRNISSSIMEEHQKSDIGNSTIMHYILDWFKMPVGFENTVILSQILQAFSVKYAVEHFRRNMPQTMGTLYWQLNDSWPCTSWSSIDYYGNWKALHYAAKKFYSQIIITTVQKESIGKFDINIINDYNVYKDVEVRYFVYSSNGDLLSSEIIETYLPDMGSHFISTVSLNGVSEDKLKNCIAFVELYKDEQLIASNTHLFAKPKHIDFQKPNITYELSAVDTKKFKFSLHSDTPVLWGHLVEDNECFKFSDNYFDIRPNKGLELEIITSREMKLDEIKDKLMLKSLYDLT